MPCVRKGVPSPSPKMALKVLQINLNHCNAAQDLLTQSVREENVDEDIIADQYRNLNGFIWKNDATDSAAIWAFGKHPFQEDIEDPEDTFARVKISGMHFCRYYMPPSMSQEDVERVLDRLIDVAKNRSPVAIAGDFIAWAVEWGRKVKKKRVQALLEAVFLLDLTLLNYGKKLTFVSGKASSMIDLTFVSRGLTKRNNC